MRRWGLATAAVGLACAASFAAWRVATFTASIATELDRASALTSIAPRPQSTIVFDRHGKPAFTFFVEQRISVPLQQVSPHMIDAVLAVEDRRFFQHYGVDPVRIVGAAWSNLRAGRIVEGGSTITQQLARAAQLSSVKTYERKIREVLVAARLEERNSKRRILEEYLNTVYFGEGYYGVEAASRGYFGKSAADLSVADAALLAALVRSPSVDAPCVSRVRATRRRNLVLTLMRNQGRIDTADFQVAAATAVPDESHKDAAAGLRAAGGGSGLYFQEELRRQLFQMFGADRVLRGGLRVYSTYDPDLQIEAERAIAKRIEQIAGARKAARDLQGSLVSMSPESGDVYAIVGGRDFRESSFNRASQVRRQRLIVRVDDNSGQTVWLGEEHRVQAISRTTAYLMSSMLSDVISSGTATRARSAGFRLPAGGKTGTTDDYADAWFIGYTPHLLTGVWFGLDHPAPIMREGFGGTVAVPAWARFMSAATKGARPEWYRMPEDVEKVKICRLSGMRAGPDCDAEMLQPVELDTDVPPEPNVYEDLFPIGSVPSEICTLHDPFPPPGG